MKRIISILLAVMLILSVAAMTGCNKKSEKKNDTNTASNALSAAKVPEGAEPIATTAEGNATGYHKFDKDEKGRVVRFYTYDSLGTLQVSIGYEYGENDVVTKELHYNADGTLSTQTTFERDKDGKETKRTVTDPKGNVIYTIVTETGEDGELVRTKYDANGKKIK